MPPIPPKIENEEIYKAPNLEKGIAVLELLSDIREGRTLQEIRTDLDISLTTSYRVLLTLVRLGYLEYDDPSKRYRLTNKMLAVGLRSVQEHDLMERVLPRMRRLRDEIKESVFFGVLNEGYITMLEQSVGTHSFCFYINPGKQSDLHCSAPGKAIRAYLPDDLRLKHLSLINYTRYNERSIGSETEYLQTLEEVKERGYAFDLEEEVNGVICIAAPIFNRSELPCGSIWTSGPKDRLNEIERIRTGEIIRNTCLQISEGLGYMQRFK